jgi:hypothetical protein
MEYHLMMENLPLSQALGLLEEANFDYVITDWVTQYQDAGFGLCMVSATRRRTPGMTVIR